jgi:hypothetical protein
MTTTEKLAKILNILLNTRNGITKNEILSCLREMDVDISTKTLDRYLERIVEFVPLTTGFTDGVTGYGKCKTYCIDDTDYNRKFVTEFLTIVAVETLVKSKTSGARIFDYMSGGRGPLAGGSFWMITIIKAMLESKEIEFNYTKYGETRGEKRVIEPYHLRLKDNLWYLVGKEPDTGSIKVFGLDRITNLKLSDDQFKRDPNFDPQAYFENYIGIYTNEDRNPELITIKVWGDFIKRLKPCRSTNPSK